MNCKLHPLILAATALSFTSTLLGQAAAPVPALPSAGGAPIYQAGGAAGTSESNIPEEFKPLDTDSKKLADSVDQALEMVKKAVTDKNKAELQKGLDELINRIGNSISTIEKNLEPESRKVMERAQVRAREYTAKAGTPGLTPPQQKRWTDMAQSYNTSAEAGIGVIKKMQDTRVELMTNLKSAEAEKELIIAEIELKGFTSTITQLQAVVDNMQTVSLRIRGMVGTMGLGGNTTTN